MEMPKIKLTKTHYILIGLAVLAFIGWRVYSVVATKPTEAKEVPVVRTMTVGATSTDDAATYPGEVRGKYESSLAFQVAGKIVARHVSVGDSVSAGDVLMEIDPKDVNQAVTANTAAVAAAQSNYKLAAQNFNRYSTLYEQGAVSQMIYDQYKTQYDAAAASLEAAQAQLNATTNQLGYTRLVADHSGSISSLAGELGMVVAAGTPVVSIVQDGEREIQIYVPENKLNTVKPGQAATITFWALNDVKASGHVTEVAPMADSVTRTYRVRVAVDTMPPEAKLGMTAKVTLSTGTASAIIVPTSAIYQTGDQTQVWVVRSNKVSLIPVKTGGYEGSNIKIASGLQKGDIVVTGGANKLSENEEVRIETANVK